MARLLIISIYISSSSDASITFLTAGLPSYEHVTTCAKRFTPYEKPVYIQCSSPLKAQWPWTSSKPFEHLNMMYYTWSSLLAS